MSRTWAFHLANPSSIQRELQDDDNSVRKRDRTGKEREPRFLHSWPRSPPPWGSNAYLQTVRRKSSTAFYQDQQIQDVGDSDIINDAFTQSVPDKEEIWDIIKQMRSDASPGLDGFNAAFYKAAWPWIAEDVVQLVQNFYSLGYLPEEVSDKAALSPYPFVLAINELSLNLQEAMLVGEIKGITLGTNCPPIHSLMFADDLIVCGQATWEEETKIKNIIESFCNASGQIPNWSKSSVVFSRKVTQQQKSMVNSLFPVHLMNNETINLGHPLLLTYKNRSAAYDFILNKFRSKLTALKANSLSHAGRLVYINYVLTSIPIYYMSNILFPKDLLEKKYFHNKELLVERKSARRHYKFNKLQSLGRHMPA
ncbi:hypothetical protein U9M48_031461 [Paspalum notatum var. saurae]|uniref:Reverse transcriptase domain-containing protein n=1 Tax=Paspalum notatum var. saurae TaxID=547442 RepID=A0AAQ3U415_PASNO